MCKSDSGDNKMKEKYPTKNEYVPKNHDAVNPYMVTHYIGEYMDDSDILIISPSAFGYAYNVPQIHGNQRYICHLGLGAMGTALPEAIGVCAASGKRTVICEGDGSLQHNIQELALLRHYNMPIKLFVDSNSGYLQIYSMQNAHFNRRYAGCTADSGIPFPNLELIAQAYGLKYIRIDNGHSAEQLVKEALSDNTPMIIEMVTSLDMEYFPQIKSKMNPDGSMQTPSLEMLFPFLPDAEHLENMKISEDN
jgi:acetolactate synthase-1/2/3 large subunit